MSRFCMSLSELQAEERRLSSALLRVRSEIASVRMQARILDFLSRNAAATCNAIVDGVRGQRAEVLAALRELKRQGRLRWEPGAWRIGSERSEPVGTFSSEPHAQLRRVRS